MASPAQTIKANRFIATPFRLAPEPFAVARTWWVGSMPPLLHPRPAIRRVIRDAALSLKGAPHPAQLKSACQEVKCDKNAHPRSTRDLPFPHCRYNRQTFTSL